MCAPNTHTHTHTHTYVPPGPDARKRTNSTQRTTYLYAAIAKSAIEHATTQHPAIHSTLPRCDAYYALVAARGRAKPQSEVSSRMAWRQLCCPWPMPEPAMMMRVACQRPNNNQFLETGRERQHRCVFDQSHIHCRAVVRRCIHTYIPTCTDAAHTHAHAHAHAPVSTRAGRAASSKA